MSKKNTLEGVLPVHKAAGMTSHDVVARLRKWLGIKKIGHAGTLDPEVTGVLPICIGNATRISEFIMEQPKTYRGQLTLGFSTTTQDFTGEKTEEKIVDEIAEKKIQTVLSDFLGEIEQIPPMYSSVKVNGKKLYELARQGKEVERKPRKVTIYDLSLLALSLDTKYPTIDFEVTCSKGTYIRTLCVDIGEKLGYPAHMSKLIRISSGGFSVDESYSLEQIEKAIQEEKIEDKLVSMAVALPNFEEVKLSKEEIVHKVWNGQKIEVDILCSYEGIIKILDENRQLYALYDKKINEKIAYPKKVFK